MEICDYLLCAGDSEEADLSDNFAETLIVLPSALSNKEIEILKSSLYRDLVRLGFRNGVFHVEARVRYLSMRYLEHDGVLDLDDIDAQEFPKKTRSVLD